MRTSRNRPIAQCFQLIAHKKISFFCLFSCFPSNRNRTDNHKENCEMVGTFTAEVASSFGYLRQAIDEIPDAHLRHTMAAITDDLVLNLENQMLLVFANCAVQEHEREKLLLCGQQDTTLLDYYQQSIEMMEAHGLNTSSSTAGKPGGEATGKAKRAANLDGGKGKSGDVSTTEKDTAMRAIAPDSEVAKMLMASFHSLMQALAHNTHAERAVLHLSQKSTGSLRALCTIPDHSIALRGLSTPSHQGVIGNCFSTGLAVRVDTITMELRRTMYPNNLDVRNVMAFPVLEPIHNHPIGVVELVNRTQNSPWTASDEAQAYQTALLLQYLLNTFGQYIDFHSAPVYNPVHLNLVHPYQPASVGVELSSLPGGQQGAFHKHQLVARILSPEQFPAKPRHVNSLYQCDNMANVRELSEYLSLMDFNMRANINDLVAAKQRENEYKDLIQKLNIRVKVQEENSQHLQDQLNDAKRVILAQKMSGGEQTGRFDGGGSTYRAGMTQRQSLTQRSLQKVPLTGHSKDGGRSDKGSSEAAQQQPIVRDSLRPSTLHDFMATAAQELAKLQKMALGNSNAMQRHKMLSTPQPQPPLGHRSPERSRSTSPSRKR